ncbi:MAG: hypothetical protein P1T08_09880 [Acidimicrobiia bacterium]|nr:hypothetical protein [Acidimicrobiia bacterium]
MRKIILWMALGVVATACSADSVATTTSLPSSQTTTTMGTTDTTSPPVSTTRPAPPDVSLIVSRAGGIDLLADGIDIELEGDSDYPVVAAFDDLAGGLVYQYEFTPEQFPADSILWIPAGGSAPTVILSADPGRTIRLLDVEVLDGRTNVLFLEGDPGTHPDSLFIADLAGGAPTRLAGAEPGGEAGPAGVTPTAVLSGSLSEAGVAVVWWYGDIEAACSYVEVVDFDGEVIFGPLPNLCGEQNLNQAALSADGSRIAYAGGDTVVVADVESGDVLGEWVTDDVSGLDFDGSTVIVTTVNGFTTLSLTGRATVTYPLPPATRLIVAARGPVDLAAGTFLGGVRTLSTSCSATGLPSTPEAQGGLPEAVSMTREAIVAAATSCDIDSLAALAGESFVYGLDPVAGPGRTWRQIEQRGGGVLARIADVLALPYVVIDVDGSRVYTWPSAFQEQPTEADWDALSAVYNEEDVDNFKALGGYAGMRVGIAEDGAWAFAVEGD